MNIIKPILAFLAGAVFFFAANDYLHNRIIVNKIRHTLGTCEKGWQMECTMIAVPTSLIRVLDTMNPTPPSSTATPEQPIVL